MTKIQAVSAIEILDSRGRPTLLATCTLESGATGHASVPSGASTGAAEALELRDNDPNRFGGYGCLQAVQNVNQAINNSVAGKNFSSQEAIDNALIDLDGTPNKSRLGANAILSVSLAFCRAQAVERDQTLYHYFADMASQPPRLPNLMINLFSGGLHGGRQTAIQDVQIVVPKATTVQQTLEVMFNVFQAAARRTEKNYGVRLLTADEGGLAPPFGSSVEMFSEAVAAIEDAGYVPGEDVALTVDVAASHFLVDDYYEIDGETLDNTAMANRIAEWCRSFPIVSVEDGLGETDWDGWTVMNQQLGTQIMILGDDLLCTNPDRIQKAIQTSAANSLLLKVNQIGTITEALQSYNLAKQAGWKVVVSARSGETEDNWLADLAVGWGGDYIKVGSITQSERLAKYNRLLYLENRYNLSL